MSKVTEIEDTETGELFTASDFKCEAFALCDNDATQFLPHPILHFIAACDRCADKLERLSQ